MVFERATNAESARRECRPDTKADARMAESNMYLRGETWFLRAEIAGRKYRESLHTLQTSKRLGACATRGPR
jgi:hypothetical protein